MPSILIIDDEKAIRYALREILEHEGHKVEEAADGASGSTWSRYALKEGAAARMLAS